MRGFLQAAASTPAALRRSPRATAQERKVCFPTMMGKWLSVSSDACIGVEKWLWPSQQDCDDPSSAGGVWNEISSEVAMKETEIGIEGGSGSLYFVHKKSSTPAFFPTGFHNAFFGPTTLSYSKNIPLGRRIPDPLFRTLRDHSKISLHRYQDIVDKG